ncbi:hypothetical protein Gogos_006519 [Gossypium gossypioides]|uniref:Zinc knuckle CX2CX4HX4C domain-containing protein n=1 Tax=Gossypium gossypioides TaxID=34282 RepID=A0A7J9C6J9_GOSGO|nr:hypothetical protein [Gossypium gossypioides]
MEADLGNLNLEDEEEEAILCEKNLIEDENEHQLCLVGKPSTDCVIHFHSFKRTLVDLWHPHLIIFHRLVTGEYPKQIPLNHMYFWIQVHNLPFEIISKGLARKLGDFMRQFVQYDDALISRGERRYMSFRLKIDVRLALTRKKKLVLGQGREGYAYIRYERLTLFCFLCGKLGHGEHFCPIRKTIGIKEVSFGWNSSFRAPSRTKLSLGSKWLREGVLNGPQRGSNPIRIELELRFKGDTNNDEVKGEYVVQLRNFSTNHIDVEIMEKEGMPSWIFIGFYSAPKEHKMSETWSILRRSEIDQRLPWIIIRDFNEIMFFIEKRGSRLRNDRNIARFREVLEDCDLNDLGFSSKWYTWERGRLLENNVHERIDRGVANQAWWECFPGYSLKHLTHTISDHCPILVELGINSCQSLNRNKGEFKFNVNWILEDICEQCIKEFWKENREDVPMKLRKLGDGPNE